MIAERCVVTSEEDGSSSVDYHEAFFVYLHNTDCLDDSFVIS